MHSNLPEFCQGEDTEIWTEGPHTTGENTDTDKKRVKQWLKPVRMNRHIHRLHRNICSAQAAWPSFLIAQALYTAMDVYGIGWLAICRLAPLANQWP